MKNYRISSRKSMQLRITLLFIASTLFSFIQLSIAEEQNKQEIPESIKKMVKEANQGDAEAQFNLGAKYSLGLDIARDYVEAVRWLRKAADQGHPAAQTLLGDRYMWGQGVTQDYAEAVRLFHKAADQKYAGAFVALGTMYEGGDGVSQDYIQAHMWYSLCEKYSIGVEGGRRIGGIGMLARKAIEKKMTKQQIAEAKRLARKWKPKKEK